MEHEAQFSADVVLLVFLKWSQPVSRAKDAFVEKLSGAAQMEVSNNADFRRGCTSREIGGLASREYPKAAIVRNACVGYHKTNGSFVVPKSSWSYSHRSTRASQSSNFLFVGSLQTMKTTLQRGR